MIERADALPNPGRDEPLARLRRSLPPQKAVGVSGGRERQANASGTPPAIEGGGRMGTRLRVNNTMSTPHYDEEEEEEQAELGGRDDEEEQAKRWTLGKTCLRAGDERMMCFRGDGLNWDSTSGDGLYWDSTSGDELCTNPNLGINVQKKTRTWVSHWLTRRSSTVSPKTTNAHTGVVDVVCPLVRHGVHALISCGNFLVARNFPTVAVQYHALIACSCVATSSWLATSQ